LEHVVTASSADIVRALGSYSPRWSFELELQDRLGQTLTDAGISFEREVRLSPTDRPDFMVGSIAVEVKVKGSQSSVERQLTRYALLPAVSEIVLVTTRRQHVVPAEIHGKPVHIVHLISL